MLDFCGADEGDAGEDDVVWEFLKDGFFDIKAVLEEEDCCFAGSDGW